MSTRSRGRKPMNVKNCICDKCGAEAHAIQGTLHRRCSGNMENNAPLEKNNKPPSANRGKWQSKNNGNS